MRSIFTASPDLDLKISSGEFSRVPTATKMPVGAGSLDPKVGIFSTAA